MLSVDAPEREHARFSYQPALDGIRALAVAAVLAYHAGMPWADGGFLGVDAFFVLSGFLITSLLLTEWRSGGSIDAIAFWARRARRLLPALFLMLIGVAFYAVAFAAPLELGDIRSDALATIAYVANWRQVFSDHSYFEQFTLPSPLVHTWSLAIEEQYYVVWPLLLLLLLRVRRVSLRALLSVTIVMAVASALLMGLLFDPDGDPSRVYYGTDTRAQSLLVGASLAMLLTLSGPLRDALSNRVLQIVGLQCIFVIGLLWATTTGDNAFLYRGGFLFLALAVAVIIAAAVQPGRGPLTRLLSIPPLRALGLISYGVYLWHWPVYMMLTPKRLDMGLYNTFTVRVLVTLAIATISYCILEMPIRRGAFRHLRIRWTFAPAGALALVLVAIIVTRGAVSPASGFMIEPMPQIDPAAQPAPTRVMLIGDSVGRSMAPGLKLIGRQESLVVWSTATAGCGFFDADIVHGPEDKPSESWAKGCREWHETWPTEVEAFRPDVVVWAFGAWDGYSFGVGGRTLESGSLEWHAYVINALQADFDLFTSYGAKFVLVTFPFSYPSMWSMLPEADELEREANQRATNINELFKEFAAMHPGEVVLADLNLFLNPEGKFRDVNINGTRLREDGTHLGREGSFMVARWLVPQILDSLSGTGP